MDNMEMSSFPVTIQTIQQQQRPQSENEQESEFDLEQRKKEYNPRKRYFSLVNVLSIISSLMLSVYVVFEPRIIKYMWTVITPEETANFDVHLKSCKIPSLYDGQSELPFMWVINDKQDPDDFNCSAVEPFSSIVNQKLVISNSTNKCCIRNISRPFLMDTDMYKIGQCQPVHMDGNVGSTEFMTVQCNSTSGQSLGLGVHATLPHKASVMDKISYWRYGFDKSEDMPYSVIMILLGTTSTSHAYRSLPLTIEFLEKKGFMTMKGYQMMEDSEGLGIGLSPDNNNMVPLLSRIADPKAVGNQQYWDNHSTTLWSTFNEEKFVTFLMDDSVLHPLNINGTMKRQKWFSKQPTDYYMKPLLEAYRNVVDPVSKDNCMGKKTTSEYLLQHLLKFHEKFKKVPTFSLSHFSWPQSQPGLESLAKMDQFYLSFFKGIFAMPQTSERTFFVITSESGGVSKHPYFSTEHGAQERLNPLLTLRLPDNLVQKHPSFLENLRTNSHRIVSPVDVHQSVHIFSQIGTLKDNWRQYMDTARRGVLGANLFTSEIPHTRSCSQAFIPERLCLCDHPVPQNFHGRTIISSDGKPEKYWHYAINNG